VSEITVRLPSHSKKLHENSPKNPRRGRNCGHEPMHEAIAKSYFVERFTTSTRRLMGRCSAKEDVGDAQMTVLVFRTAAFGCSRSRARPTAVKKIGIEACVGHCRKCPPEPVGMLLVSSASRAWRCSQFVLAELKNSTLVI